MDKTEKFKSLKKTLIELVRNNDNDTVITEVRAILHELSLHKGEPVDYVRWVPIEKIQANDYNPNSVAQTEMRLLHTSISHDGYTQPVVTIHDKKSDKYIIVDGFHRYHTMKTNKDIFDRCGGKLPIVVIEKGVNERMAATIRHNRARGKHSVAGMSNMVFTMLDNGWADEDICNRLGMEPEELLRLKHITGFSKLFADREYNKAWVTRSQIRIKKKYQEQEPTK